MRFPRQVVVLQGKGAVFRVRPYSPAPRYPENSSYPPAPLLFKGDFFGFNIEEIPTSRGFAPFLGMTARGAVVIVIADAFDGLP